jgi:hypothetical protein
MIDAILRRFHRWPYQCRACAGRFHANLRFPEKKEPLPRLRVPMPPAGLSARPTEPTARIVVRADSHEQLDHILCALDRAISSYGRGQPAQPATQEARRTGN